MNNKVTTGVFKEKDLERKLREKVKKLGGKALKFASAYATGWPDRFIFMPGGKIYLAEIKTTFKDLTPKQRVRVSLARKMGFTVFVICTDRDLGHVLDQLERDKLLGIL